MMRMATFPHREDTNERILAFGISILLILLALIVFLDQRMVWAPLLLPFLAVPLLLLVVRRPPERSFRARVILIGMVTAIFFVTAISQQVAQRHQYRDLLGIHDGAVQTENAVMLLLRGENPYSADYRFTSFGQFPEPFTGGAVPNPAWQHYVYLPFTVLVSVPFSLLSHALLGWYDQRFVYLLAAVFATIVLFRMARGREWKLLTVTVFLWNPLWLHYFFVGHNDILVFSLLVTSLWNLRNRHWLRAGAWYGLAAATKQSAWPLAPFLLAYLVWTARAERRDWRPAVLLAAGIALLVILPFFLWNPQAFLDDVYRYAAGSSATSYPIAGFGLSSTLLRFGVLKSMWDPYPAALLQLIVGIPLLLFLLRMLRRRPTLSRTILFSAIFSFGIWYVSRFFHVSYLAFLSALALSALALADPPRWPGDASGEPRTQMIA